MQQTCTLFVNYRDIHVPKTINDCDNISICFALFAMNPLKSGLGNMCLTIMSFNFVHIIYCVLMPSNFMSQTIMVMILQYVRSYTWQDIIVHLVTHLTWSNIIHKFSPKLHLCNQSCFVRNPVDQHVEDENLLTRNFPWKTTFLDVIIMIHGLEFNDFVNLASPWTMLEQNKKITNIWRVQFNKLVLDVFLSFALKSSRFLSLLSLNKCLPKKDLLTRMDSQMFSHCRCLVDLFFDQHFSLFHSLFMFTIYNMVEMHTKVISTLKMYWSISTICNKFDICNCQHKMERNCKICI